ncbi:MAG: cellulose biosynthesis cyclic di-GMP-binding regulatory protein BcsB [Elainellaceae cyanobacterium]
MNRHSHLSSRPRSHWRTVLLTFNRRNLYWLIGTSAMSMALIIGSISPLVHAQEASPPADGAAIESQAQITIPELPIAVPTVTPVDRDAAEDPDGDEAGDGQQYILEFNRSPVVGNRLRLTGIYDEARLQFTRPRNWEPQTVKVLLRYRHSAALYATRSNLTVLVNGTSVGSVPLNQPQGELGEAVFDIPTHLIKNYNELIVAALQNNSPTCTQDALDPSLWTEVMPDSKLVFDYQPQPISLDFSRYPYPIYDELKLEPNQIAYLLPSAPDQSWLTSASRLQASLGRIAEYRVLDTRLVSTLEELNDDERLIIVGTPDSQPALAGLDLPIALENNRFLDGDGQAIANDTGILMLAAAQNNQVPVLVATGNSADGVAKAIQFLAQPGDRQIATGNAIFINEVTPVVSADPRAWPDYLPLDDSFQLHDLKNFNEQSYDDVTVRGSHSPALIVDFHALPDDQFLAGNFMTLRYSYGPQVNPLTSLVEIQLDGVSVGGRRLSSVDGGDRETLRVELPADQITPQSQIQVNFRLDPRERRSCSRPTDQQLWGTIHSDTSFDLNRENVVRLPDLNLLRTGFPFAAPQDLSSTAIVLPDQPSNADIGTLLAFAERLGRLSEADSLKLEVYPNSELPDEVRDNQHLVGVGTQDRFPFAEAFETDGFRLQDLFTRQWQQSTIQTLPDTEGLIKQIISPWNQERVLLALSSQTDEGLSQVQDLLSVDALFYQLEGDTVLISTNEEDPSPYETDAYNLEFLEQAPVREEIASKDFPSQLKRFVRGNWIVLGGGIVAAALILYGVVQLYLKRVIPNYRQN